MAAERGLGPDAKRGIVLALCGLGNIGSFLVRHLVWMPGISKLILIDKDSYDPKNLGSQAIQPEWIGRPKAEVQRELVLSLNPALEVLSMFEPFEAVQLGLLERCDLILCATDSRISRKDINAVSLHFGVPWINGAVANGPEASEFTCSVYVPGPGNPCLTCDWSSRDFALLEDTYPCHAGRTQPSTDGVSYLGAMVAAMMASECARFLSGDRDMVGREFRMNLRERSSMISRIPHNPRCRSDHSAWQVERLSQGPEMSVRDAFGLSGGPLGSAALGLEGVKFVRALTCLDCGRREPVRELPRETEYPDGEQPYLANRIPARLCKCSSSRQDPRTMLPSLWDTWERLEAQRMSEDALDRPLSSFGFRPWDILMVSDQSSCCGTRYELGSCAG